MARVIEAVQIFKKVEDVTSAKDDPPPVYLMDDLSEMARASAESSEKIADRVAKRLQHKSPVVKYKALRLTRHIVNKGCHHFQRAMQRHANLVRDLIQFKGDSDPFKGDTPNQRVRDTAKEAADALFNSVMAQPVSSLGSRIQGFGSSAAPAPPPSSEGKSGGGKGSSAAGAGSSSSRMTGFGSSGYTAPASSASDAPSGAGGSGFASSQRGVNRPLTGGYGSDAGNKDSSRNSGGGYGGYSAPAVAAVEVLGSEEQLVDGICTPGGLRLAPDPDDLRRFVEAVGSLDGLKIGELLHDKMDGSGSWQQLLRALYAVEAVLLQGASQACGEIAVMFQSDPTPVQAAASHPQAPVRERATRVLRLLLGDSAAAQPAAPAAAGPGRGSTGGPAAPPPAPQQSAADLLGGLDMLGSPVHGSYGAQSAQQHQLLGPGMAAPGGVPSGLAPPLEAGLHYSYGQQSSLQQQQQPLQPPRTAAPPPAARPGLDPFGMEALLPAPGNPPSSNAVYSQQQMMQPPQQQQQMPQRPQVPPQHQALVNQGQHNGYGGLPPMGAAPAPMYGAAPRPAVQAPPQQPNAARAAPLDDLFADMNLAGAAPGAAAAGGGSGYVTNGTYGGPRPAYMGPSGLAGTSAAAAPPMFATGNMATGSGASRPGSQLDLMGMSAATGSAGGFAPLGMNQAPIPGSSGVGTPTAAGNLYGAPYGGPGTAMHGNLGGMAPAQSQPPLARPHMSTQATDLLGGFNMAGSGAPAVGTSGAIPGYNAGAGGWSGAGYGAATGMGGGPAAASGMGMGASMVVGASSSSGMGMGLSMGLGSGGGMVVGPGGQVRFEQQQQQPGMLGSGMPGGWQQPYPGQQQQGAGQMQQLGGAAGSQQQQRAFDFVMDQFK